MKISNSKRQLAQIIHQNGGWRDGKYAIQDKDDRRVWFMFKLEGRPNGKPYWPGRKSNSFSVGRLLPNWHQTVLSRDEFDQIVAAENLPKHDANCRCAVRSIPGLTVSPTLDQLLQDWRNADDYAQRKQAEADEAAAMRDQRWQAVQDRAGEMGVTVGRCEPVVTEPEVVAANWRDVRRGDFVWVGRSARSDNCPPGEYRVATVDASDSDQPFGVEWGDRVTWPKIHERGWHLIRRP